jgi:hypothetical protein
MAYAQKNRELTRQVRIALADPRKLAKVLGLDAVHERQARGIIVRCPAHKDLGRPNLSITTGRDGTARCKCHACGFTGDALTLVATVHGLTLKSDFRKVLILGAELSGNQALTCELEDGAPRPDRIPLPEPRQQAEPEYPKNAEDLWGQCLPIDSDSEACMVLKKRGIDPERVTKLNLARVLPKCGELPDWAHFGRRSWRETGHRIIVRTWEPGGIMRSVRAWRVTDNDTPKRLPPAGCRSAGLVLADRLGWRVLSGEPAGVRALFIVEGEPDWLAASLAAPGGFAVIGIGSGWWSAAAAEAARSVRRVIVATHPDMAGDRYAALVCRGATRFIDDTPEPIEFDPSLGVHRAVRWRPPSDLDETGAELQSLLGCAARWLFVPHQLGD